LKSKENEIQILSREMLQYKIENEEDIENLKFAHAEAIRKLKLYEIVVMVVLQEGDPSKEISSSHISFLCLNKAFVEFHCFSTSVQYSVFFSYLYNFKHSDFKSLFFNTQALWINSSAKRNEHIRIKTLPPEVDVDGVVLQFPRNIRALKNYLENN
jgi:hypothetical protein